MCMCVCSFSFVSDSMTCEFCFLLFVVVVAQSSVQGGGARVISIFGKHTLFTVCELLFCCVFSIFCLFCFALQLCPVFCFARCSFFMQCGCLFYWTFSIGTGSPICVRSSFFDNDDDVCVCVPSTTQTSDSKLTLVYGFTFSLSIRMTYSK